MSLSLTRSLAHSCGMFKEVGLLQPEVLLKGALLASLGRIQGWNSCGLRDWCPEGWEKQAQG